VSLAKIGKAVGLRGDLLLWPYNDASEHFKLGSKFLAFSESRPELTPVNLTLEDVIEFKDKSWRVKFAEINSREEVEQYTHWLLGLPENKLKKAADEYFVKDLIGLKVYENSGALLGEVTAVDELAGLQNLEVRLNAAFQGLHIVDIPMREEFVLKVSMEERRITVIPLSQMYAP